MGKDFSMMNGQVLKHIDKHVVQLWEYERGWGSRLDEEKYFDSEIEAKKFVFEYNTIQNTTISL